MSKRPLLIGHSHVHAPMAAVREYGLAIDCIAFWSEPGALENTPEGLRFRPDIAEKLQSGGPVYSFIGGNAHTVLSLVEHHRPFDLVLPQAPALPRDPDRECLPVAAARHALEQLDTQYTPILDLLLASARGPVMQALPPPPVAVADVTREKYPWQLTPGQPREFAPAWLRLKVWRLAVDLISARCARLGVALLPLPPGAADTDGFLRHEYRQDVAHANAAYGALLLREWGLLQ